MTAEPQSAPFHSGFVTFVGRPNAGKSTLTNALVGQKVAITSDRAQTTRHRLRAVLNLPDAQIIIVDTPGLHRPHDALGEEVNRATYKALEDTDLICLLVDATGAVGAGDRWVAELLAQVDASVPRFAVLTKTDLATEEQLAAQRNALAQLGDFSATFELSAVTGAGLPDFVAALAERLPEGPLWFPADMTTDQSPEVLIAEFIREKALRLTYEEVPHAIGVALDELEEVPAKASGKDPSAALTRIFATLYVEHNSQKGIVVGKGGAQIKRIGMEARADLERLLGTRVFLDLRVKVKKNWRRDAAQIRRFGYGEGS